MSRLWLQHTPADRGGRTRILLVKRFEACLQLGWHECLLRKSGIQTYILNLGIQSILDGAASRLIADKWTSEEQIGCVFCFADPRFDSQPDY
jgi:hypothetical protein